MFVAAKPHDYYVHSFDGTSLLHVSQAVQACHMRKKCSFKISYSQIVALLPDLNGLL